MKLSARFTDHQVDDNTKKQSNLTDVNKFERNVKSNPRKAVKSTEYNSLATKDKRVFSHEPRHQVKIVLPDTRNNDKDAILSRNPVFENSLNTLSSTKPSNIKKSLHRSSGAIVSTGLRISGKYERKNYHNDKFRYLEYDFTEHVDSQVMSKIENVLAEDDLTKKDQLLSLENKNMKQIVKEMPKNMGTDLMDRLHPQDEANGLEQFSTLEHFTRKQRLFCGEDHERTCINLKEAFKGQSKHFADDIYDSSDFKEGTKSLENVSTILSRMPDLLSAQNGHSCKDTMNFLTEDSNKSSFFNGRQNLEKSMSLGNVRSYVQFLSLFDLEQHVLNIEHF